MSARASLGLRVFALLALAGVASGFATDGAQVRLVPTHARAQGVVAVDSLQAILAGEWGWIADGPGCHDNPHTISVTRDGRHLIITYREPFDSTGARTKRYEIRSRLPKAIRAFLISPEETRRTAAGEAVVWDLLITARDVYNWHRTDWPDSWMTRSIVRCGDLQAPASDPEGTARVFLEAIAAQQFLLAAQLTDPAELQRNRLSFDSLLAADTTNYLSRRILRIDSVAELRRMSDAEFTARLQTFAGLLQTHPSFWASVRGAAVIGSVRQGSDTVHVVYKWRFAIDSLPMRSPSVTTMIRSNGRWWAQMLGDYRGLIALLKEPMVPVGASPPSPPQRRQ